MNTILNEISGLRHGVAWIPDHQNRNRYRVVTVEPDGSRTAYYFAAPIYNNVTRKLVLSSIFRKFDSEKMKLCAGKSGEGAAKPRLIAAEHMPAAVSGAAKPFILTLDSAGGICYLIAALMPLLLRLRSDISYIDTAWFPTPFPKHTAVWHRPA